MTYWNKRSQKYIDVTCLDCKKTWEKREDSTRSWDGRCRTCAYRLRTGEVAANWKGGITDANQIERGKFKSFRRFVIERDEGVCQVCLLFTDNPHVDHIKRWSEYPELRFELDNCRTLCMACHYYVTFKRKIPEGITWGSTLNRRIT